MEIRIDKFGFRFIIISIKPKDNCRETKVNIKWKQQ